VTARLRVPTDLITLRINAPALTPLRRRQLFTRQLPPF
jgi:hypothetical protein